MKYVIETSKSVEQATDHLQDAVKRNGFGVLHTYDLTQTLRDKGSPIDSECRILEVCNPQIAREILTADMSLNMALPCRISVYEQDGQTRIGLISPRAILSLLSDSPGLSDIARDVEDAIKQMIEEAK